MSNSWAWSLPDIDAKLLHAAERAARRARMSLGDWLNEAILLRAGEPEDQEIDRDRDFEAPRDRDAEIFREANWTSRARRPHDRERDVQTRLASTIERIERRVALGEQRTQRAIESIALVLERTETEDRHNRAARPARAESVQPGPDPENLSPPAASETIQASQPAQVPKSASARLGSEQRSRGDLETALAQIAARRRQLDAREGVRPAASGPSQTAPEPADPRGEARSPAATIDNLSRKQAEERAGSHEVGAMRIEMAAMTRSLADLAPRNAVVALEGAVRDLTARVELLRQNGHGEHLLAPLDAMAAELRASLKAYDPGAATAALAREIHAISGKIDGLAEWTVKPETFEAIRRQTEEVRNLLAAAATRTLPLDRLERRIGDLADRIEKLGVSAAPQIECAQMAAALADLRRDVERATPVSALASIESRLEQIAQRLDRELAARPQPAVDPRPFEELARRIEGVRESVEKRAQPDNGADRLEASLKELTAKLDRPPAESHPHDTAAVREATAAAIEPLLREISGKLERATQPAPAAEVDMRPLEDALRALGAKFDGGTERFDRRLMEEVADETARRMEARGTAAIDANLLARQIGDIHARLDLLASPPSPAGEQAIRAITDELKQTLALLAEAPSEASTRLAVDLARMRSDQADAERRTEASLSGLHGALEKLIERLGAAEREGEVRTDVDKPRFREASGAPDAVLRGLKALNEEGRSEPDALRSSAEPIETSPADGADFLLEPGSGAPQLGREARELAQAIGSRTSPSVTAHIAAARRAAQAALTEGRGAVVSPSSSQRARLAERGTHLYVTHRRSLLLAAALVVVAVAALRLAGPHGPFQQRSDVDGPARTAAVQAPPAKPVEPPPAVGPPVHPIDTAPTASIGPAAEPKKQAAPDLMATLPLGLPEPLRNGVAANAPAAQYELALRLLEGRGTAQDPATAARWLERAANAGLAPAEFRLGALYEKGVGVAKDPQTARSWYRKAAEAGNLRAAHNLAVLAAEPAGGSPDYAEAVKWFRKAGDMGVRDSQYNLAILYARGLGVDQDLRQSWMWFSLASAQGDADAARKRDEVAAKLDPAGLAAAADMLGKFKAGRPDPAANDAPAPPPGGWDAAPQAGGQSFIPPAGQRVHTVL